jgi:hypothetical protein
MGHTEPGYFVLGTPAGENYKVVFCNFPVLSYENKAIHVWSVSQTQLVILFPNSEYISEIDSMSTLRV